MGKLVGKMKAGIWMRWIDDTVWDYDHCWFWRCVSIEAWEERRSIPTDEFNRSYLQSTSTAFSAPGVPPQYS